jgi:hypothetical protein
MRGFLMQNRLLPSYQKIELFDEFLQVPHLFAKPRIAAARLFRGTRARLIGRAALTTSYLCRRADWYAFLPLSGNRR